MKLFGHKAIEQESLGYCKRFYTFFSRVVTTVSVCSQPDNAHTSSRSSGYAQHQLIPKIKKGARQRGPEADLLLADA